MMMINLLYTVVFTEMAVIVTLLFGTPLRTLVMMGIDLLKSGKGPLVAKTVAATILVVFVAVFYTVKTVYRRSMETGATSPTDEVILAEQLLEATLMGFSLFLALMIDRLHDNIKELHNVRQKLEELKRLNPDYADKKTLRMENIEDSKLIKKQESNYQRKSKDAKALSLVD